MTRKIIQVLVPLLGLLYTPWAGAHHSNMVSYDLDIEVVHRDVTVVEWQFNNPHALLVYEFHDDNGNLVKWAADSENLLRLRRNGYSADSFQPGQLISVRGNPERRGKSTMNLVDLVLNDGTVVNLRESAPPSMLVGGTSGDIDVTHDHLTGAWEFIGAPLPPEARDLVPENAVFVDAYGQAPEMVTGETGNYPLTEPGRAFQARWTLDYDECRPVSAWIGMVAPYLVEFDEQYAGRIHLWLEFMDLERTIWMDGRAHPPVDLAPPTNVGHSVGHWEGDTLVVETVNMLPNQITRNGIHHSDEAIIREWISRDGDELTIVRTLEDPEHLTTPITEVVKRVLATDRELVPYGDCTSQLSKY